MEVKVLMRNEEGKPLAATCKKCGKFTLDTHDFLCASCSFDHIMRYFFAPTVRHTEHNHDNSLTTPKEDEHVSKS